MKKTFSNLLCVAIICTLLTYLYGCADLDEEYVGVDLSEESIDTPSRSLEEAVYHEGTESWMVPQKDPYALENFQKAYDKLSSGSSSQTLTKAQQEVLFGTEQLKATHYCLKIYPKNEDEQWKIELMEDIKVAYVPFNYVSLPKEVAEKASALVKSANRVYPEKSNYTVTYDDLETSEGPVEAETYVMPILYTVWPCNKPLPSEFDYEIDYEIFIPSYGSNETKNASSKSIFSQDVLQLLEAEAISLALGTSPQTKGISGSGVIRTLTGTVEGYDYFTRKAYPQINLKQRFQLGSNIWETYTQSNGFFSITAEIPTTAMYSHVFQHPRWKITRESTMEPISIPWGTVADKWKSTNKIYLQPVASIPVYQIHPAVNHFYNGSHAMREWYYESGIRIRAMDRTDASANAFFTYSKRDQAYISVYSNDATNNNYLIGSVLHEFGHFCQYGERGGYSGYTAVHKLLRESFASYVGWHIGEMYYATEGYVKPSNSFNLTGQGRQDWWKIDKVNIHYTPLFVDLVDDFNQYQAYGGSYNPDPIKNFPHSIIIGIARECTIWNSVKAKLNKYVGVYYTSAELNSYMAPYDYWFARN